MRTVAATALILILNVTSSFSQAGKELVIGEQPVYGAAKATGPIVADGVMDEEAWANARVVTFDYFFRRDEPLEKQRTEFRMLWDEENIYLFYDCEDTSITARETGFDGRPYLDDCAEFFVLPVPDSLYMHFGYEVNVVGARYDYVVLWQFANGRTVFIPDYNPTYEVGVTMNGTLNDDNDTDRGWTMEYVIPMRALRGFDTRNPAGTRWAFQAVRQDRNAVDDRFRSTSTLFPTYDVALDVHPPYRFGLMEFVDN